MKETFPLVDRSAAPRPSFTGGRDVMFRDVSWQSLDLSLSQHTSHHIYVLRVGLDNCIIVHRLRRFRGKYVLSGTLWCNRLSLLHHRRMGGSLRDLWMYGGGKVMYGREHIVSQKSSRNAKEEKIYIHTHTHTHTDTHTHTHIHTHTHGCTHTYTHPHRHTHTHTHNTYTHTQV